jgi:hypothetical protein
MSDSAAMIHLIRLLSLPKGLFMRCPGEVAQQPLGDRSAAVPANAVAVS